MKVLVFLTVFFLLFTTTLDAQVIRKKVPASSFETVTIVYTADFKGLHTSGQTDAPASAVQTILSELRKEYDNTLLVDLGNFMGATPTTMLTDGKLDFQVMELLGYDLLHVSTDDFVIGAEKLKQRIVDTKIPVLTGNLDIAGSKGTKWNILSCGNRTVGFIGLTSQGFEKLVTEDMRDETTVESASAYIAEAIHEMAGKADIVVALTDFLPAEIAAIRDIPGLDLIITTGGDSAEPGADWISVGFPGKKNAAVVRTLLSGPAVHVLEIHGFADQNKWTINEIVGDVYEVTKNTPRENATDNWFQWQMDNYVQTNNKVLGELKETLSNEKGSTQQTPLGSAVTDIMRNKTLSHIAIARSGALRKSLEKGPVTEWDLIEAIPYPDSLEVIELTGAQIEAVIARSRTKSGQDGYLQFSGLTVDPPPLGNRIGGIKIVPARIYTVTLSAFLAQGGEGYDEFKGAKVVEKVKTSLQELCRRAFEKYGTLVVDDLPMDNESNFWFAKFHIDGTVNGFIADPSNLNLYPNEPTLVGQQLVSMALGSRFDLIRRNFIFDSELFVDAQYGLFWGQDWVPIQTLDIFQVGTQFSFYLSNLLFGGVKTLDPYASVIFQTVMNYPDPTLANFDPNLPRPGSLKIAGGMELTVLDLVSLKLGFRWQKQPFNWDLRDLTGLEAVLAFKIDIFPDILSFDTQTELFSSFDIVNQGLTFSSVNHVSFALMNYIKIGPRFQLFYNSLVGHMAYFFDVSMTVGLDLGAK